jgi:hypothetical protein
MPRAARAEALREGERLHGHVLIEVRELVDAGHREAGSCRRFGGRPRRDAREKNASHSPTITAAHAEHAEKPFSAVTASAAVTVIH